MDDQNKNLILATALSFIVILVWFVLFPPPEPVEPVAPDTAVSEQLAPAASGNADVAALPSTETAIPVEAAVSETARITIKIVAMSEPVSGAAQGAIPQKLKIDDGSGADRSLIQPIHGAWRNSIVTKITLYSEKKIGICNKIGRQPEAGFTLLVL